MIHSFADRETERLWQGQPSRKFPPDIQPRGLARLELLDLAETLTDLSVAPGNRFEALRGDREGQYSIRINRQWRVCFRWADGAHDVAIVDYH